MTTIRDIIKRNIGVKIEGVVKVSDQAALSHEIREYVLTDNIEDELRRILDTFAYTSETLRRGSPNRDVMGIWVSGFFGSGKSHFAKVLGHLLQNTELHDGQQCIDEFDKHLSDTQRGANIRMRLAELKLHTSTRSIFFEIKSRQPHGRKASVGEILLSEFYRSLGYSENLYVALLERSLERRDLLSKLEAEFERQFGVPWRSDLGRDDLLSVQSRLGSILPVVAPSDYPDREAALQGFKDVRDLNWVTPARIADELVSWVDDQATGGKSAHLIFVIDEMGTFIGDSNDLIGELNSLAEMIGNKGKGKVWLIVTSQQDLEKVVDRTNFQPALVGRLNARFELKPSLISDEITKVVSERILKKRPAEEVVLHELYRQLEGRIAQLADIKASRSLGSLTESAFVDAYPLLPHQIRLAQDIFEALSGFRISGGVRSMISVVMETLQGVANDPVGVVVSFDQIFDAVKNDLLSQEYLGASGIKSIVEADERVLGSEVAPSRVLKVLWLLQRVRWVPRVTETLAKLLISDLETDLPTLRDAVENTLGALQKAGYVARDEATLEWKYLSERERSIEQAIQELMRPGVQQTSLASLRRRSQEICRSDLITRKRFGNFAVTFGKTPTPFPYGVFLDNEAVDTGPELEVHFVSPLASGRSDEIEEIRRQNQMAGVKGKTVWWVANAPSELEARLKRYQALDAITGDKRFVDDASKETQEALSEKRSERDKLRESLVGELERAFASGKLFYGGQEVDREGGDLKEHVSKALRAIIPNIYSLFSMADKPVDFARQLQAILNPTTAKLSAVAPDLDLFDTQGILQRDGALPSHVLEVLRDIEDDGRDPSGAALLDSKDANGFKGFSRAPYGWPDELLRLVLAACFRAGAVYVERQTSSGLTPGYDYQGSDEEFLKISVFKRNFYRVTESSLSIEQIKQAGRSLIALGKTGIPESAGAIASAVRELGTNLKTRLGEARVRAQQGLPISDAVLAAEDALTEATTILDPTKCVMAFLDQADRWKALSDGLNALDRFLEEGRQPQFELSRRLGDLAVNHALPGGHPMASIVAQAREDMDAIMVGKGVIARWTDYRDAFERLFAAYRDTYTQAYREVHDSVEAAVSDIRAGSAYSQAPPETRDRILDQIFGTGGPCNYPSLEITSVSALLNAASRRSLGGLAQALVALPGYVSKAESELHRLAAPAPQPGERIFEWRPAELVGQRFRTEADVDQILQEVGRHIKAQIQQGFTVVVK